MTEPWTRDTLARKSRVTFPAGGKAAVQRLVMAVDPCLLHAGGNPPVHRDERIGIESDEAFFLDRFERLAALVGLIEREEVVLHGGHVVLLDAARRQQQLD